MTEIQIYGLSAHKIIDNFKNGDKVTLVFTSVEGRDIVKMVKEDALG